MNAADLEVSLRDLDILALAEYHVSLPEVVTTPGDSDEYRLLRLGRLLGVILKQPFAESKALDVPSPRTGAYQAWKLKPDDFENPQKQSVWQYRALEVLRSDPNVIRGLGGQLDSVYSMALTAQSERGFFWYLAMACRSYLCGDPKLRSEIEREVRTAKHAGVDLKTLTPGVIVASGGLTIGTALVQSIPALAIMGAPVIAGLVFIIYSIGISAFCQWASDHENFHVDFPNADTEDKSAS